jgi:hypothetical protein
MHLSPKVGATGDMRIDKGHRLYQFDSIKGSSHSLEHDPPSKSNVLVSLSLSQLIWPIKRPNRITRSSNTIISSSTGEHPL